jgi:hypothetical protein
MQLRRLRTGGERIESVTLTLMPSDRWVIHSPPAVNFGTLPVRLSDANLHEDNRWWLVQVLRTLSR